MNPIYNLQTPLVNPGRDVILLCDSTHDSECQEYIYADINYARKIAKTLQDNSAQIGRTKLQELWVYSSKHNKTAASIYAYYALQDPNQDQSFYKVLVNGMIRAGFYTKHKNENPTEYDDPSFGNIDNALNSLLEDDNESEETNNSFVEEYSNPDVVTEAIPVNTLSDLGLELESESDITNTQIQEPLSNNQEVLSTEHSEEETSKLLVYDEKDSALDLKLSDLESNSRENVGNQDEIIGKEQVENQEPTTFDLDETLSNLTEEETSHEQYISNPQIDTLDIKTYQNEEPSNTAFQAKEQSPIKQIDTLDSLYQPITEEEIKKLTSEIEYKETNNLDKLPAEKEYTDYPKEWEYPLAQELYAKQQPEETEVEKHILDSSEKSVVQEDINMNNLLGLQKNSTITLEFVHNCLLNSTKIIEKAIEHNNIELFSILDTKMQNDIKQAILSKISMDSIKTLITNEFINSYKDKFIE